MPPAVAVSTVAIALRPPLGAAVGDATGSEPTLWLPLVRRTRAPFLGMWALPGGPTRWNETLSDTALRTLHDAVLRPPGYLEQLYSFGGVERSADAQRLVTIAYWALYGERDLAREPSFANGRSGARTDAGEGTGTGDSTGAGEGTGVKAPTAAATGGGPTRWDDLPGDHVGDPGGTDLAEQSADLSDQNVAWFSVDALPPLAFDHPEIVAYALERLRRKTEYEAIAHRFLGPVFTLGQLRAVHEAVLGESVDPANFRRQELARGRLIDTGEFETGTPYRPARLYRFRDDSSPARPLDRPTPNSSIPSTSTKDTP